MIFRAFIAALVVFVALYSFGADRGCVAKAEGSIEYQKATDSVRLLPEFASWSSAHSYPVSFGSPVDNEIRIKGRCFWSVTVYANRSDRLELWNVFYVNKSGAVRYVSNQDGEPTLLTVWRNVTPTQP
jgi:hypothetical protein